MSCFLRAFGVACKSVWVYAGKKVRAVVGGGVRGRDALEGNGPQRRPQKRLDRRLEEVSKAVRGDYCRLQMPLKRALAVRETVAGHWLGALEERGGAYLPPSLCIPSCRALQRLVSFVPSVHLGSGLCLGPHIILMRTYLPLPPSCVTAFAGYEVHLHDRLFPPCVPIAVTTWGTTLFNRVSLVILLVSFDVWHVGQAQEAATALSI